VVHFLRILPFKIGNREILLNENKVVRRQDMTLVRWLFGCMRLQQTENFYMNSQFCDYRLS